MIDFCSKDLIMASRVLQWSKALHRSVAASLQPGVRPQVADFGRQLNGVSSDTWVQLASGLSECVLRSEAWRVMFRGKHDSTFASPEPIGKNCLYNLQEKGIWSRRLYKLRYNSDLTTLLHGNRTHSY
jgi:hypothetical protein